MAQNIGVVALSVILLLGVRHQNDRNTPVLGAGVVLSTLGVLLTTLFTGFFIYFVFTTCMHQWR